MIKTLTFTLFVIAINISVFGQYPSNLKTGLFNSLEDLMNNNPKFEGKLNVTQRTETDIQLWGGNDYKVNTDTLNIKKSIIKNCFAVFDGNSLYINGMSSYPIFFKYSLSVSNSLKIITASSNHKLLPLYINITIPDVFYLRLNLSHKYS